MQPNLPTTTAQACLSADASEARDAGAQERPENLKRTSCECTSPLDRDDVLGTVLSFVGIYDHLYIGGVSKRWRERGLLPLSRSKPMQLATIRFYTSYRSVFKSAARFQWAIDSKLELAELLHRRRQMFFAHMVAAHSPDPAGVMSVARAHGLQWFGLLIQYALKYKNVELLLWLVENGCPWDLRTAVFSAIDSVPMLQGIRSLQTEPWPAQMRNDLMWEAGLRSQTATLSWLHEQGTDWPYSFARVQTIKRHFTGTVNSRQVRCWSFAAVQLALSRGST
jgi:hypothetical protein